MRLFLITVGLALGAAAGHAAQITQVTPQGEAAQVRQVTVRFSEPVVRFGDLSLPDPVKLACQGDVPRGAGRWADATSWVYDFRDNLPPGTRCTVSTSPGWQPIGGALTGPATFRFNTGGPAIVSMRPYDGAQIDEDQFFVLRLSGPAVEATLTAGNAWCEVDGLGEKMPVRVIAGAARDELLNARRVDAALAARTLVLACQRPLPPGAAVRFVWGKGIAATANPRVVTTVEQRHAFEVRPAFTADFSCERERANAPCLPIRLLRLGFSAPVPRALAASLRLQPAAGAQGGDIAPTFDADDKSDDVEQIAFAKPLAENSRYTIALPRDFKDTAGRPLANAASFPLAVATGAAPPIAKFAAAPFGVVEWGAEAMLPVTLRQVQGDLAPAARGGQVRIKRLRTDADILAWYAKLARYDEAELTARELLLPEREWTRIEEGTDARGKKIRVKVERTVGTREVSLLASDAGASRLDLPQLAGGDPRPFEVVGIPLAEPGYHVVEIESQRLGAALLDKPKPMYVRTGVLVTNLGLHFKWGRENSLAWVTTLDRGQPVDAAEVAVNDCRGKPLWQGRTDASGLARIARPLDSSADADAGCPADNGLFVTARKAGADGRGDTAFVFSSWQKGIEPWRFNVPTGRGAEPDVRAHTVFDRTLLRAGETVSMKHFVRLETVAGLAAQRADALPTRMKIVHQGSNQEFVQPLAWRGTRFAAASWRIPPAARLGVYSVVLERGDASGAGATNAQREWTSGSFRVEEFRVPLIDARLSGPKAVPVAPAELAVDVQLSYLAGGAVARAPARASALLTSRDAAVAGYDDFVFEPPRDLQQLADRQRPGDDDPGAAGGDASSTSGRLVADKLPLTTDAQGAASFTLKDLPKITRPSRIDAEVSFNDPNGEVQTVSTAIDVWPSAVVLGVKTGAWASRRGRVTFSALALDTGGKPLAGQKVEVRGRLAQVVSHRKRLVGGFYAYDNRTEVTELGSLCSGSSDARGLLACSAELNAAGEVELIASAVDARGHAVQAAASVWVTRQGELWFAQDNDDRIDVLPEKKRYEPGETARLQVRMPFREATALVAVEREGIVDARVVTLRGDDPTIELKVDKAWGPNVYVSVLALRGRVRDTPWYSFFTWGWKEPLAWTRSFWYGGREYQAPTALVDLAKPAFKLGVAALEVGLGAHALQVQVTADKPQYAVRQTVKARVKVAFDGRPLAGAEIAFAAVDEGLLALQDNPSWDLLRAMFQPRAWGVETSTAQSEIIGRRHYGRKAVPAGGGGGTGGTRELFDTLLLWKAQVALDANGEALIEVPLNDALTTFRLVAIADAGDGVGAAAVPRFGSGSTRVRVTQDLQLLAGLPPLVREGDRFSAMLTLRNTTPRELRLRASLAGTAGTAAGGPGTPIALPPQDLVLAAGAARELVWPVDVPAGVNRIVWEAAADEQPSGAAASPSSSTATAVITTSTSTSTSTALARDRLKLTQQVDAAVPLRVLQATLQQLDGPVSLPVAAPATALPDVGVKRGGLVVAVQPSLTGALPGLRRYFETYPFICLEQQVSRSVGLKDAALWATLAGALPTYLDRDGLANYFPPRADDAPGGSDKLTAYLVAATHEAGFALPAVARDAMLAGLAAFVEGRIERRLWSPASVEGQQIAVRKLAAIDALARHGRAEARMLGSVNVTPNLWPTAAVIDWLNILKRVKGIANAARHVDEANQILRSRLTFAGTTLRFSTEESDFWWWLMDSADANAARLILAVVDDPAWRDDLPRLVVGTLGRQRGGAWLTTTANLWGALALDKFSARFEAQPVSGTTRASMSASAGGTPLDVDWSKQPGGGALTLPWPAGAGTLEVAQQGAGKPWLTVQSLAALPLRAPVAAGYSVVRSVTPVTQKEAGRWSRGDVLRVRLTLDARADMTWVVVSDPVPAGAAILGSGLGRDSAIAARGERREGTAWPAFEERGFAAFRSYHDHLPRGRHVVEYTLRLNNPGRFSLPPTRVEAMYAPETFGEAPNAALEVGP